jgi:peptidylprolyl isomerase
MDAMRSALAIALAAVAGCAAVDAPLPATKPLAEILAASPPGDWRPLDPENTLYMDLASGRVVIELAPEFAPRHVENIRTLAREKYFDGLAIIRVHDGYVTQWGDADDKRDLGSAARKLAPEFTRSAAGLEFTPLPDRDTYASETGFSGGFAAALDAPTGRAWMVHCYATVGVGRGNEDDSGSGASLYAVIGNAPRLLDRNITVVGRVVRGIELLTALPRGTGNLGFYEKAEQRVPIREVRMAADIPESGRVALEVLRTGSATFKAVVDARRFRRDTWYKVPARAVDVCNVSVPVRSPKS